MAQYIDKDAIIAEIERRKEEYKEDYQKYGSPYDSVVCDEMENILSFLDTLEVKEVGFEKELDRIWFDNKLGNYFDNDALDFAHIRTLCKHFFELGLAQKGE